MALELPVALAEDVAGEDHARIGRAPHLADVVIGVRRATDDRDPNPTVTCTPQSGSVFPLGATTRPAVPLTIAGWAKRANSRPRERT